MSEVVLSYRGRLVREADVVFLRELIAQNPGLSRRRLSARVCEAWQWRQPNGQLRDMVCRGLMLALHRAGQIQLPAKRRDTINNAIAHRRVAANATPDTTAITGTVASLGPLSIRLVRRHEGERTGTFTTSIVAEVQGHTVALYFTGWQHAGENLADVLRKRAAELAPPIQMCDALSRNTSGEHNTLLAHCLAHGRRGFVSVAPNFPEDCRTVLEALGEVYPFDAEARQRQLDPQARLRHHQLHSQPVMARLKTSMQEKLDQKQVEPNSGLGQAIGYMLKYWEPLTLFLHQPGAPLDNNICERVTPSSELPALLRHGDNSELTSGDEAILDWRRLDRDCANSELLHSFQEGEKSGRFIMLIRLGRLRLSKTTHAFGLHFEVGLDGVVSCFRTGMSKKQGDDLDRDTGLEERHRAAIPEAVRGYPPAFERRTLVGGLTDGQAETEGDAIVTERAAAAVGKDSSLWRDPIVPAPLTKQSCRPCPHRDFSLLAFIESFR